MQRISVRNGWVDFRDPEDVPERLRRRVTSLSFKMGSVASKVENIDVEDVGQLGQVAESVSDQDLEFINEFNDAIIMCMLIGWSYDEPISQDALRDLPHTVYTALLKPAMDALPKLMPDFSVDPDPKAPIES